MLKRLLLPGSLLAAAALLLAGTASRSPRFTQGAAVARQQPVAAQDTLQAAAAWFGSIAAPRRILAAVSPSAGEALFHEKGCIACHGEALQGTERGPALTGVGRTLKRDQIEHQIRNGGGNMPPFGEDAISSAELMALVDFLAHQKKHK